MRSVTPPPRVQSMTFTNSNTMSTDSSPNNTRITAQPRYRNRSASTSSAPARMNTNRNQNNRNRNNNDIFTELTTELSKFFDDTVCCMTLIVSLIVLIAHDGKADVVTWITDWTAKRDALNWFTTWLKSNHNKFYGLVMAFPVAWHFKGNKKLWMVVAFASLIVLLPPQNVYSYFLLIALIYTVLKLRKAQHRMIVIIIAYLLYLAELIIVGSPTTPTTSHKNTSK